MKPAKTTIFLDTLKKTVSTFLYEVTDEPLVISASNRLFNFLCFFNAATNLLGTIPLVFLANYALSVFNLVSSGLFFLLWYLSRYKIIATQRLYWSFTFLILVYLDFSHIANSGSLGGTQYYFILGAMFCIIVASSRMRRVLTVCIYVLNIALLFYGEYHYPEYFIYVGSDYDSMLDRLSNYAAVIIFVGYIVYNLTYTLQEEKEFSDRLLKDMMPEKIADELKKNGKVIPERYNAVTVIFIDMVGFSKYTLDMPPVKVLELLSHYYNFFDSVFLEHNLEKIKTLGDGYMAAGGIPKANTTHARDAIDACLEILRFVNSEHEKKLRDKMGIVNLNVRIGMNTGPVIAGVIGIHKYIYDIWGTTVNLASRMESFGLVGKVNVSESTYKNTCEQYEYTQCRSVEVKNMGRVNAYIVKGRKT